VIGFFVIGLPYWQIPYAKVSLPSSLYGPGLLVVGVLAAAARIFGKIRFRGVVCVVGASVPAPILARIVIETTNDPTSHNLWPFEVIIAAMVGGLCSSAGALAGGLFARLSQQNDAA
jgi:hypothetical protein